MTLKQAGLSLAGTLLLAVTALAFRNPQAPAAADRPNVVIIFLDDAGWADFEPFDKAIHYTPNMQRLAERGMTFSNYYVPQGICSASRAALLTGCYPGRTKVFSALAPRRPGLDTAFATMAEILREDGYRTALFGKWHLGDTDGTRPWDRGFEETAGLLYSNDMWKRHPEAPEYWGKYPLQFFENGEVLIDDMDHADQETITKRYTDYAVDFIDRHREEPFFLYVPHSMPHVPLYVGADFAGKSGMGLYADVIMELDWSIGAIHQALEERGLAENTIFVVTSDNGPWLSYGDHAGKTPFREGKGTTFDGGTKTGMLMKYPALFGRRHSSTTVFSIDLLPTIAELTGTSLAGRTIDGVSFADHLRGSLVWDNPQPYYALSNNRELQAIISGNGRWKLHVPHRYRTVHSAGGGGTPGKYVQDSTSVALYDLETDPFERIEVGREYPAVVEQLLEYYESHREKFAY